MQANKPYSILFVTHYTDLYGANRSLLNLIEGLQQNGINNISVIIPHHGPVCDKLNQLQVAYHIIPFVLEVQTSPQPYIKRLLKKYYNFLQVKKHYRLFKTLKNLVVHTNSSVTFFGAYLANYLRVPHVWHIREFGKADYNLEYNFGKNYFIKWINKAAAVICISKALCEYRFTGEKLLRLPKVIYNGVVSLTTLDKNIQPHKKNKTFTFGISGNITREKNQIEAIEAFNVISKNYDCELLIAGTGKDEMLQQLKELINRYGLENRVKFKGFIDDVFSFYDQLDCLLMCSKNEALGRVSIEAMSKGLPVIGYDNAGTSEIIKDGYNGILYSNGYNDLAGKMKTVIENYEDFFSLRLQAIKTTEEHFTIESNAKNIITVYNSVAG